MLLNHIVAWSAYQSDLSPSDLVSTLSQNRQAQKRFRLKQREKINTSAREVEKLTTRMAEMQMRQRELEARNQILEHTCELTNVHLTDLTEKQVHSLYPYMQLLGLLWIRQRSDATQEH